jgi:limonene-1,2-epoxide hydrolase
MTPAQIIQQWVEAFNNADANALEAMYATDAVNHQMPNEAVIGKTAIGNMFRNEFAMSSEMHCMPVQIIEQGNWAVLEWRDPKKFRGCGFFEMENNLIKTQRGYWDKLTFYKLYNIPFTGV